MNLNQLRKYLPANSKIWLWLRAMSITEAPTSYAMASALVAIGCALKNNAYFSIDWAKIKPSVRMLLIGPSGIGKDVTINWTTELVRLGKRIPTVGGATIENVLEQLSEMAPPAAGYLPVGELASLVGQKDYQKGAMPSLTDVMSDNDVVDISLKSKPGKQLIMQPHLILVAGSTQEWLHNMLPQGALEGGFIPRMFVWAEEYTGKSNSVPRFIFTRKEIDQLRKDKADFITWYLELCEKWKTQSRTIDITNEAFYLYDNWYRNRQGYFSETVRPYAFRSREMMLKTMMICAISRGKTWIDEDDVRFGEHVIHYIASRIDQVVVGKSLEGKCRHDIQQRLPATRKTLALELLDKYDSRIMDTALRSLVESNIIKLGTDGTTLEKVLTIVEEKENE